MANARILGISILWGILFSNCGEHQHISDIKADTKLSVHLPVDFSTEDSFQIAVEDAVFNAFNQFPIFSPEIDNAEADIVIKQIKLLKVKEEEFLSGTVNDQGNIGEAIAVNTAIGDGKFSVYYNVKSTLWRVAVRGTYNGKLFSFTTNNDNLRLYESVHVKYWGHVTVDILKVVPKPIQEILTKAFADIFTVAIGAGKEYKSTESLPISLEASLDGENEVSDFQYDLVQNISSQCQSIISKGENFDCSFAPIVVTPFEKAFSQKLSMLNQTKQEDPVFKLTDCRKAGNIHGSDEYILVTEIQDDVQNEMYVVGATESYWQNVFYNNYSPPKAEFDKLIDHSYCPNGQTGQCAQYMLRVPWQMSSYANFNKICAAVRSCASYGSSYGLSKDEKVFDLSLSSQPQCSFKPKIDLNYY